MTPIKIGLLREGKIPFDKRVAFTPSQCSFILQHFAPVTIVIQPSAYRCYTDEEYTALGIPLQEDLSDCDVLMGIKEVPVMDLLPSKKYLFFSHTIKKQPYNKRLMQAFIEKKIQLIDYECLTDKNHNRIIGFGHYAGIVGAYNGLLGYGIKHHLFTLKRAYECYNRQELKTEFEKIKMPPIKIIVTGNGRVANGAIELLGAVGIRRITPFEFLNFNFREVTYTQLHSLDYNEHKVDKKWNKNHFYATPQEYQSTFGQYTGKCDLLMHCAFWHPQAPKFFSKEDMRQPEFKINFIADITCDIDGAIPSTLRSSTIADPFYDYDPFTEQLMEPFQPGNITVMAVDNLPCELPRDASEDFGKELIDKVLPALLVNDTDGLIARASITKDGRLTEGFVYLEDYAR